MGKGSNNKLDDTASESNDSDVSSTTSKKLAYYDWDEIRSHNKKNDLWVVVEDNVYNLTGFRRIHPGGEKLLDHYAGQDATVSSFTTKNLSGQNRLFSRTTYNLIFGLVL
jgi:fatty acid desaturase 2 (delta-6 desaturase)